MLKGIKTGALLVTLCIVWAGLLCVPRGAATTSNNSTQPAPKEKRSVCISKCLRKYEKCQRKAANQTETTQCYETFESCQQTCYETAAPDTETP